VTGPARILAVLFVDQLLLNLVERVVASLAFVAADFTNDFHVVRNVKLVRRIPFLPGLHVLGMAKIVEQGAPCPCRRLYLSFSHVTFSAQTDVRACLLPLTAHFAVTTHALVMVCVHCSGLVGLVVGSFET
jgi:hypothetical protein